MMFTLRVNGSKYEVDAPPDEPLLTVLRDRLQLTGTKYGCGEGQCGACTVLLDDAAVRSCRIPAGSAAPKKITTIEGLARGGTLHSVQAAFIEAEAFQCGYCTSGMIMSAVALLQNAPNPTDEQILTHMNGNVCRCGTYARIMHAIHSAASRQKEASRANR